MNQGLIFGIANIIGSGCRTLLFSIRQIQLTLQLSQLYKQGNYKRAVDIATQLCKLKRQQVGEEHPDFASFLYVLASLHQAMGEYTTAEPLHHQALKIRRASLGENHPNVADSLNNLAGLYQQTGKYRDAELLFKQVLEIRRKTIDENHPNFAAVLNNLATISYLMGNYAAAEPLYRQANDIWQKVLGKEHPSFAKGLNNLAVLYRAMGNYAAAESLYRQATEIRRTTLGENHPEFAQSLINLATLYTWMENYAAAEPLYQKASDIFRKISGENHPDFAASLHNQAFLYTSMGEYKTAKVLVQQELEIRRIVLGENHPLFATSLNSLAGLNLVTGEYSTAEHLCNQAVMLLRKSLGDEHPELATSLINLAVSQIAMHRENEAFALMQEATSIENRIIGQVFSISSESQRMAYLETLRGNFELFLSQVFLYLSHNTTAVHMALELVLRRKAIGSEVLAVQRDAIISGRYPNLLPKLQELNNLRMQIAQETLAGPGQEGLGAYQQLLAKLNDQKERLEAELARQIPEMNLEQQLRTVERQAVAKILPKGSVLVEFVYFGVCDFQAMSEHSSLLKPAHYLAFVLPARMPEKVQMIDLGEADFIDQMISKFRESTTGEAENRKLENMLIELIQAAKSVDSPKLHSAIFEPLCECGLSDAEPIEATQEKLRNRKLTPPLTNIIQKINYNIGFTLRRAIFDPLLEAIGDCKRLFLAPDGDLTKLPFQVLPLSGSQRLIDEYHINYLSTGRDLLRFQLATSGQPTEPLVIADPDFDLSTAKSMTATEKAEFSGRQSRDLNRSNLNFQRLSGTRIEGERIAEQLCVKPLLGEKVLETRLKNYRSPRILHLATHGFFLKNQKQGSKLESFDIRLSGDGLENPLLRSGLALAGANTWLNNGLLPPEAEDGILTAEDVSGLDLLNTELVVLSACETGLGEVHTGEGVFGLRRAFVLAGAKRLIMSLWSVPDQQTQELMTDFYDRMLKRGQPCADALRDAQLEMRKKYSNPLYWGAFIFQGDPSCLSSERTGE